MAVFPVFSDLRSDIITPFVIIMNDESRHIMILIASHEIDRLGILRVSYPLTVFQSIGKFIVTTDIVNLFRY